MTNVYVLAKTWRYLMIIPAVILFLLFWSLFIFGDGSLDMPLGAWMLLIVVTAISGSMIYGAITSKLITSLEGIEHISFGIQVRVTWTQVERIEFAPDGIVNLHFKEPVYINGLASALVFLYPYDKTIQLSPYTGDLATSKLLKDLASHVPNSNIPEFASQQKYSVKTFQEAGVIGLYYLGWFLVWALFAIVFQEKADEYLAALGLPNARELLTFIDFSLLIGLFVNTLKLMKQYNAEIIKLDENEIAHKARAYYLIPFVILLISPLVGVGIWTFLPKSSDVNFDSFVMFLIGAASLPVSTGIERLFFRDNIQ